MLIGALVVVAAIVVGVMSMGGDAESSDGAATVAAAPAVEDAAGSTQSAAENAAGTNAVSQPPAGAAISNAATPNPATATPTGAGNSVTAPVAPTVAPLPDPGAASAAVAEAQRELKAIQDRIRNAPDDEAAAVAVGRAEIPRLESLLPRFTTSVDSVWVYVWLSYASIAANDPLKKSSSLRYANRLATSSSQLEAVMNLKSASPECL
jgi:hypothetical protein